NSWSPRLSGNRDDSGEGRRHCFLGSGKGPGDLFWENPHEFGGRSGPGRSGEYHREDRWGCDPISAGNGSSDDSSRTGVKPCGCRKSVCGIWLRVSPVVSKRKVTSNSSEGARDSSRHWIRPSPMSYPLRIV